MVRGNIVAYLSHDGNINQFSRVDALDLTGLEVASDA